MRLRSASEYTSQNLDDPVIVSVMVKLNHGDRVTYDGRVYLITEVDTTRYTVDLVSVIDEDIRKTSVPIGALSALPIADSSQPPKEGFEASYTALKWVLGLAVEQASAGKGLERHASPGERFEEQQIVKIGLWLGQRGSPDFNLGQAAKKALEAARLPREHAQAEILGAINYLAGAYLILERLNENG